MKNAKQVLSILLAVLIVGFCMLPSLGADSDTSPVSVKISTDKTKYSATETAKVTVSVQNNGNRELTGVIISLAAKNWRLAKGEHNILDVGTLDSGAKKEMTVRTVVDRKASGVNFLNKILLFFRDLFKKPSSFQSLNPADKDSVSTSLELQHGGAKIQATATCWFDASASGGWTDEELKKMESVDNQIQSLTTTNQFNSLDDVDQKEQVSALLNDLQQNNLIQSESITWEEDTQSFFYSYSNGTLGGVVLKEFGDEYNGPSDEGALVSYAGSAALSNAAEPVGDALLLYSFNYPTDSQDFRNPFYVSTASSWTSNGLQTTRDTAVTVKDLKNIGSKYEVVCFNGHGSTYNGSPAMCLSEKVTSSNRQTYAAEIKSKRIAAVNCSDGTYYWVLPALFSATYGSTGLQDKLVFAECCNFFGESGKYNYSFANAFINAGVRALVGYHNSVAAVYCRNFMKYWVDSLVSGKTAKQSFDACVSKYGRDDGQPTKAAIANFYGDESARLTTTTEEPEIELHTGDLIEFGSYPQSLVTDEELVSSLDAQTKTWKSYGYYSGSGSVIENNGKMKSSNFMQYCDVIYNGQKYRGVTFSKYRPTDTNLGPTADNSNQDNRGYYIDTVYWFRYDSLQWRVLDGDEGLVLCETIIDNQTFNNYLIIDPINTTVFDEYGFRRCWGNAGKTYYACNYEKSSIRAWLSNQFLNTAFSETQRNYIDFSLVENNAYSTKYAAYGSNSTTDQVFLLSWDDAQNTAYGFVDDPSRQAQGSDYAKCQGLSVRAADGCSSWLLRSAGPRADAVCCVKSDGTVSDNRFNSVTGTWGIRPAMRISGLPAE